MLRVVYISSHVCWHCFLLTASHAGIEAVALHDRSTQYQGCKLADVQAGRSACLHQRMCCRQHHVHPDGSGSKHHTIRDYKENILLAMSTVPIADSSCWRLCMLAAEYVDDAHYVLTTGQTACR